MSYEEAYYELLGTHSPENITEEMIEQMMSLESQS